MNANVLSLHTQDALNPRSQIDICFSNLWVENYFHFLFHTSANIRRASCEVGLGDEFILIIDAPCLSNAKHDIDRGKKGRICIVCCHLPLAVRGGGSAAGVHHRGAAPDHRGAARLLRNSDAPAVGAPARERSRRRRDAVAPPEQKRRRGNGLRRCLPTWLTSRNAEESGRRRDRRRRRLEGWRDCATLGLLYRPSRGQPGGRAQGERPRISGDSDLVGQGGAIRSSGEIFGHPCGFLRRLRGRSKSNGGNFRERNARRRRAVAAPPGRRSPPPPPPPAPLWQRRRGRTSQVLAVL